METLIIWPQKKTLAKNMELMKMDFLLINKGTTFRTKMAIVSK